MLILNGGFHINFHINITDIIVFNSEDLVFVFQSNCLILQEIEEIGADEVSVDR